MTTLIISGFLLFALIAIFWGCYKDWMKQQIRNENQYDMVYLCIQEALKNKPCLKWFEFINDKFVILRGLKWRNQEKTNILYLDFKRTYLPFAKVVNGVVEYEFDK
jgi:hypothetical protein